VYSALEADFSAFMRDINSRFTYFTYLLLREQGLAPAPPPSENERSWTKRLKLIIRGWDLTENISAVGQFGNWGNLVETRGGVRRTELR